jgi:hypothetical protein
VEGSGQKIKMPIIQCSQRCSKRNCNKFQSVFPTEHAVLLEYMNPLSVTTTQETNEFTMKQLPRPLVKMAEHNRIKLIWVPGYM